MTRRQARDAQRAARRRREARIKWGALISVVVIGVLIWILVAHPFANGNSSASKANNPYASCPAATATPVGPLGLSAPSTPPAVKGETKTGEQGLQYIDMKVGCGPAVKAGDQVVVIYSGWVQSTGKLFDSSLQHDPSQCGGTAQGTCGFGLASGSVIDGWVKGVAGMQKYGERRLIIPPALAYGAQGSPPTIPGNATLIFDITVVGINGH
jgi:hypothetical protein